ncbi:MAG: hypothetical protein KJZ54_10400 [Phycisphaerales bacterium]|nr:hypothetical protein [Phycisphaerales bacterium]
MTSETLQALLNDMLEELIMARDNDDDDRLAELAEDTEGIRSIRTYDDVGMLTHDKGLVVECDDGTEYQITIVRSR